MASIGSNPRTWVPLPYMSNRDCSQGFCSMFCPQWCYIVLPPPPPPPLGYPDSHSGPSLSPVVIAVIGILVSAFLLISYYTILSKYCGNARSSSARVGGHQEYSNEEMEEFYNNNPSVEGQEPWQAGTTAGLDEALIKSIAVCKYKKGDGLVQGTDCAVCLGEFREEESLRLLPKCCHAFHVLCIDTWLRTHSSCPLCRANAVSLAASSSAPPESPPQTVESHHISMPSTERVGGPESVAATAPVVELSRMREMDDVVAPKNPPRIFGELGSSEQTDVIIEIQDRDVQMGRSVSMNHLFECNVSDGGVVVLNLEKGSSNSGGREQS